MVALGILQGYLFYAYLNDILVIHNWLIYAKKIGDLSYKKIVKNDQEILSSPNMDMDMSLQLSERVSYFSSN